MSSILAISKSGLAAADLRRQVPARDAAKVADTTPVPDSNTSSNAGPPPVAGPLRVDPVARGTTVAAVTTAPPRFVSSPDASAPAADSSSPVAAPNVDLANTIAQQTAASQSIAANAKAIQAGSNAISPILDIKV
jgi:flagellar basal body rod protein FlgC